MAKQSTLLVSMLVHKVAPCTVGLRWPCTPQFFTAVQLILRFGIHRIPVSKWISNNMMQYVWDSRGQLRVVDQVLQRVTAAELVQQAGQVTDDGRRIRCVDVPWDVPNLHKRKVPVGIRPLSCWDLQGNDISVGNAAPSMQVEDARPQSPAY